MKLKPHPVTYNGQPIGADEFAFIRRGHADTSEIIFPCQGGRFKNCIIRIRRGEPLDGVFGWDGNEAEPTITPSIGCDHRCGWHGHLIKGDIGP